MLIRVERSCLLVIDIQEKLLAAMHDGDAVTRNAGILMRAAGRLDVPVLASEQYPQGLGPTVDAVAEHFPPGAGSPSSPPVSKVTFSCAADQDYRDRLLPLKRKHAVIVGIEAHVCVLQTALELTDAGYRCFVVADAVASRTPRNHVLALERMNANGCEIVTTEMVLFEWLRAAGTDEFKELSKLVR